MKRLLISALFLVACAADTHAPSPDAGATCTCESDLALVHVTSSNGREGDVTFHDLLTGLCPTTAQITCANGVYTDECDGQVTSFELVSIDGACHARVL